MILTKQEVQQQGEAEGSDSGIWEKQSLMAHTVGDHLVTVRMPGREEGEQSGRW
jgi:hypothetical protein